MNWNYRTYSLNQDFQQKETKYRYNHDPDKRILSKCDYDYLIQEKPIKRFAHGYFNANMLSPTQISHDNATGSLHVGVAIPFYNIQKDHFTSSKRFKHYKLQQIHYKSNSLYNICSLNAWLNI